MKVALAGVILGWVAAGGCAPCRCPSRAYRVSHVVWEPSPTTYVAEVDEWGTIVRVDTLPGVWRPQ